MSEPPPIYTTVGEQLDPSTLEELARHFEGVISDNISSIRRAERAMEALGVKVESVIISKSTRHKMESKGG